MRHRATTPSLESKKWEGEEKGTMEIKGYSTLERKTSKAERIPKSTSKEFGHNAGNVLLVHPKMKILYYLYSIIVFIKRVLLCFLHFISDLFKFVRMIFNTFFNFRPNLQAKTTSSVIIYSPSFKSICLSFFCCANGISIMWWGLSASCLVFQSLQWLPLGKQVPLMPRRPPGCWQRDDAWPEYRRSRKKSSDWKTRGRDIVCL